MGIFKRGRLMVAFDKLRGDLSGLGAVPHNVDIYKYAVKFFNIIAHFQDKYNLDDASFAKDEYISTLKTHIERAGRKADGWVQAPVGKKITLDNLFLSIAPGRPALSARAWLNDKDDTDQANIQKQLRDFIESHRVPIIGLINKMQYLRRYGKTNQNFSRER